MILLTGGSGTLGRELQKHIKCFAPTHRAVDILKENKVTYPNLDLIVHCAAFTDLVRAEKEKELCYQTNVIGTRNLASLRIPMLYISTEYVFSGERGNYEETDYPEPQNFYSLTKLLGEYESRRTKSVVIRCLFKPRPFKHEAACVDQWTSGSYADVMAKEIALGIMHFDKLPPTIHIGFERKSTLQLASDSRDVRGIKLENIKTVKLPRDTSLNSSLWNKLKESFND